jgi:xanthine/CO dehydrogenase XdhC/CoxF family maturation factor
VHESFASFVAQVVEVTVQKDGTFKVDRVVCAVDCGIAVNPDVIAAQMEGGIGYALAAALTGTITLKDGVVEQSNFNDYPVLRINEMPKVEVHIVKSAAKPTGVGEPGVPPLAPALGLLIIGAGQISRYLAAMAQALDYAVTICDPRPEYRSEWQVAGAHLADGMPDDVFQALNPDPHLAVVALTHDPKLDDLALLEALKSSAFYVGALGSRRSQARRRERLLHHFDLSVAQVDRLHGPVGIPIGSRTPPEIAVSILAEMTAAKYGLTTCTAGLRAPGTPPASGAASTARPAAAPAGELAEACRQPGG